MGRLNRFDLSRIIKDFRTTCLFETGTLWGDGVSYALQSPFKKIFSVEIIPEIAKRAKERFGDNSNVDILEADSVAALNDQLPFVRSNIIFWLDAHFPGADAGLENYDSDKNDLRLPLLKEIETINSLRKKNKDVLIIDDLRIYEDGPYENGNAPRDTLPKLNRDIGFVYENFNDSHVIIKSYLDEGYLLLFPRSVYRWKNNKLLNIFRTRTVKTAHYLA